MFFTSWQSNPRSVSSSTLGKQKRLRGLLFLERAMNHVRKYSSKRRAIKVLLSWGCLAVAVMLISRACSSGQPLIKTRSWSLVQFVGHLQAKELAVHVVSTHKSGTWSDGIFLTTEADATWLSLQALSRTVEKIDDWNGVVLVEQTTPGFQLNVSQWGKNGLQIDGFVLFGDSKLLDQIEKMVLVSPSTSVLRRFLLAE